MEVTTQLIPGQSIVTVIEAMGHKKDQLIDALESALTRAQKSGSMSAEQAVEFSNRYRQNLDGYTYLECNDLS